VRPASGDERDAASLVLSLISDASGAGGFARLPPRRAP
jgi:hypothetical protein